ncbi:tail protein [Acinetobacter baumannii]|uniref:Phage tail protein n=2 Tax=Acinetobacter baumannii TaxID=470 RepID=A0A5N5XX32_ACIBA|nr:tail protein [Acinetobacter baumannii]ALJ87487.1 distal long tail fiber assembly catalyst [Acinetobacter baumannii]EGJ61780.1 phage tail fibre adhesin Gp38 [Acinetobacter baumannii 6013150]EGJ65414.1 phage tail fibre adhesin Gp38 [Acinetobacter baumannii 6013113]EHU1796230.1 phage tail protein [Acinetobacter baumannii]EHU2742573.1 phage tail protein [Acinetobacter baumannii]
MKRIDSANARPDVNGAGKAGFHDNSDLSGQDATYLTPDFLNTIQEELANLLELRGITLDPENRRQLFNALAGKDDLDAAMDIVQSIIDNERNARIKADQDHLDALNPHPQYVMRKDFRLLYRTLTPETTINPKIYADDPQNWQVKHTVENISAHIMPNGVIEQTIKVRTVYGDYNAQVYLPIGLSNILNVSALYQGQRENQDAEDDSAIRLLDIYDETVQLENGLQECKTVVNFRFDYVSGSTGGQRERFAYLKIMGFGASNTDLENLNSYPYPYYRNQDDLDGQVVYIDQNLTNVSLLELFIQTYGAPTAATRAIFVIASGVTLIAVTSGSWLDGSSRQIINYGHIYGTGGSGGYYDANVAMVGDGGTAIIAQNASSFIDVRNYGLIAGGGGGGAAGKSEYSIGAQEYYAVGAGGGGIPLGTGGSNINQTAPEGKTLVNLAGEAATLSVAGNGATGTGLTAGDGGNVGEDGKASESTLTNGIAGKAGLIYQGNVTITNIGGGQVKGRTPSN